jgi:nucleoside-diphosphate-sugar epimerase
LKNNDQIVLVTGATGMLGARLVFDLLQKGEKVRAIYRNPAKLEQFKTNVGFYAANVDELFGKVEWVEADVLQYSSLFDALKGVAVVCHCAAMVSFYKGDRPLMYETNIEGTRNMVNAALECGVDWFCHVSSIAALGKTDNGEAVTEETSWIPQKKHSGYSISKFHSEMEVWRGINEGLSAVIVNPSVILGPGDWNSGSPAFFDRIFNGLKFYTSGITGFVGVNDVSKAIIDLCEPEIRQKVVGKRFVLNSENKSYCDVFSQIAQVLKVKAPAIEAGKVMLAIAWRVAWLMAKLSGTKPLITCETVQNATEINNYDGSKVAGLTGMHYQPINEVINEIGEMYLKTKK